MSEDEDYHIRYFGWDAVIDGFGERTKCNESPLPRKEESDWKVGEGPSREGVLFWRTL